MNQKNQITSQYRGLISKLQELIRYYKIAKKNDKNNVLQERVKNKTSEIVSKLKAFPAFQQIQIQCKKKIDNAFKEPLKQQGQSVKSSKESQVSQKPKPLEPKKHFGPSSQFSGNSDSSSQSSNSSKKPVIQQKPKFFNAQEKTKIETPKLIKEQVKAQIIKNQSIKSKIQTPKQIIQTLKPTQIVPEVKSKIEVKQKIEDQVIQSLNSSKSSIQQNGKKQSSSISSIQNVKANQKESKSQESNGSQGSLLSFLDESQSLKDYHFLLHKPNTNGKEQLPQKEDDEQKYSQASVSQNTNDTIIKFCSDNKEKLNTELQFNEDVFDHIRYQEGNFVYLYGVNKPQGHKTQKLYVCTLMKFSIPQVFKCDSLFEKQNKDFKNNIRTPIGLIIKGESPAAIQPEHIKFLTNLQCPVITVLVLKDYQQYDGFLCHFHQLTLGRIRISPRKQLGQYSEQLLKNTYALPFNESFMPKEKTRYVITKLLNRTIVTPVQQAPNAIHISDNECIRQQKNSFNYKLHGKFFGTKPDYAIYFVNNGVVNARKDFKDFQLFKKQVLCLQPKIPIILFLCINRDVNPVKKQFFELALQSSKIRDPIIFLHLSTLKEKKTVVVALKSDITLQMIEKMQPMQIKQFQKDNHLTYCVQVIGKTNLKDYQDPNSQLTEIKSK